jgi:hypothetical protein
VNTDELDDSVRRAIGGDPAAVAWIGAHADDTDEPLVLVMAAVLDTDTARLDRARTMATSSVERQVVEIARAHLEGRTDQVDALARDHLVDHPGSLIVAWIASGAVRTARDRAR